jgi:hypothetical protein
MTKSRDPDRLIRAFLAEGQTDLPDQIYDAVRDQIEHTHQRVVMGPWRFAEMNNYAKLAIAAAVVVVVAIVGINLLPRGGGVGGDASPSPSPTQQPTPSPSPVAFPPGGQLAVGRHSMIRGGVPLSVNLSDPGWESYLDYFFNLGNEPPDAISFLFWDPSPVGVYADPCAPEQAPPAGPSIADLAEAMSTVPGTELISAPTDVTVGGRPAKHLVITVPEASGCAADESFYLWYGEGEGEGRYATALGARHSVWIVDVDGTRLVIEAESYDGAVPDTDQVVQGIVRSIQFE